MPMFPSRRVMVGSGLAAMTAMATAPAAAAERPGPARALSRAIAAYSAIERHFGTNDGSGLVREQYPAAADDRPYSYEWPFSQVHIAALDLTAVDATYEAELARRSRSQEHFWNAGGGTTGLPGYDSYPVAPYGSGGDMFYDDNEWVGLAKVQRHLQTGDAAALARAKEIFALVRSGWDTDTSHAAPGGVFWAQADWSHDRNTVSNMPGAQLALRLHQITGKADYLHWARRFYDWTNSHLQSPGGLYWDHLDLEGTIEKTFWSYNQGVPVGVNVLLYEVTRDRAYLRRAERIAEAAYDYYVTQGRLFAQPVFFNSIFFKNLLLLESATRKDKYHQAMADYADQVWSTMRDPATGLVHFNAAGGTEAIQQAAFAQIYAVLAWPRAKWRTLY
ncbi:glycoside hydrolase family 76 protein [Streptomyces sp. IB201691-2A2]|uniref:glycoside hydrolase family 76 protein n=1 Tax=Streptomyces sp. IB201691-2A2 TaxID=2561920 RepID=UPI00117CC7CE|nr:glycoside hydrolase family 76 protein [Streptomyces sp. IB201691-2A2]TRO59387.1 glycosyl hydrolase [Streptomyces sp. IB201691-2A2]